MRILIINYYFEPMIGAHAYRWSQIAKEWASLDHDVEVISGNFEHKSKYRIGNISIKRIGRVRKEKIENGSEKLAKLQKLSLGSLIKLKILNVIRKIYRALYWPDGLWLWLPFLILEIVRRKSEKYDLIISYSPTFSAHLGALVYKKISKSQNVWVADYGDPFSPSYTMPPNNLKIYSMLNHLVESIVIKSAQMVSMTNKNTLGVYRRKFPIFSDKIVCIPHLVDIEKFYCGDGVNSDKRAFRFVYVGGFHQNIREPYFMLKFFRVLECAGFDFRLDIYGPLNGFDIQSKGNIRHHGLIPRSKAIDVIRSADCLVNVENTNCLMTPSKLVEYVATGKPILNFIQDDCSELLLKYEASGFVFNARKCGVVQEFLDWIESVETLNSYDRVLSYVGDSSLGKIASKYLEVADVS